MAHGVDRHWLYLFMTLFTSFDILLRYDVAYQLQHMFHKQCALAIIKLPALIGFNRLNSDQMCSINRLKSLPVYKKIQNVSRHTS